MKSVTYVDFRYSSRCLIGVIFLARIERAASAQLFRTRNHSATRFRKPATECPLFPKAMVWTPPPLNGI